MFWVVLVFPAYRQPAFLDRSGGPRPPVARIPFSGGKYYLDKNLLYSLHNILQRMLILLGAREREIWKAMFSNTNNSIPSQDIDIVFSHRLCEEAEGGGGICRNVCIISLHSLCYLAEKQKPNREETQQHNGTVRECTR